MEIKIPILTGSNFDLTKFDFSFKDLKILDIQSKEFESYIESLAKEHKDHNLSFVHGLTKHIKPEIEKKYAVVKMTPTKDFKYEEIENVWKILLIIYPSDLQIENIIHYHNEEGFFQSSYMTSFERRTTGEYPGDLLFLASDDITEVNEFIKLVFDRLSIQNYIGFSIENYIASYAASHFHYQYLSLCISLETIIDGHNELAYRIRRNISVLCGQDAFNCDIIFKNVNKLYSLRSSIVHGSKFDYELLHKYIIPLKAIVSRTIIELLIHNIPTNIKLNEIITTLGYGDRAKISAGWKHFKLNISTIVESNWKAIE